MQHFILTRFNVASPGREAPIRNTSGWLSRRFDLFEDYCLPSIAAQTVSDFHWLIYFDEQTPDEFRARIAEAQKAVAFDPIFVGPFHAGLAAIDVQARLISPTGRLLTTRLDNDDGISNDFFERVREVAVGLPDGTIINFRNGIALSNGKLFAADDESNPFTSMVEQVAGAQTIWAAPHTQLKTQFALEQVSGDPCWLQVVHGENVANRIKGARLSSHDVLSRFTLSSRVEVRPTNALGLVADRLVMFPLRRVREVAITIAKRLLRR